MFKMVAIYGIKNSIEWEGVDSDESMAIMIGTFALVLWIAKMSLIHMVRISSPENEITPLYGLNDVEIPSIKHGFGSGVFNTNEMDWIMLKLTARVASGNVA